jgi:hypothetical protein
MRFLAGLLVVCLSLAPARAEALTLRDIVELHKAGLSDDVIVALVEVRNAVFTLDQETMKALKADGLSDRVLIAIINSGRTSPPQPVPVAIEPEPEPAPQVIVVDHHEHAPAQPQVIVQQVPVYVPVPVPQSRRVYVDQPRTPASPFYTGQVREAPTRAPEPVYWGFGGKLRPDAWQPAPTPDRGKDRRGQDRKAAGGGK